MEAQNFSSGTVFATKTENKISTIRFLYVENDPLETEREECLQNEIFISHTSLEGAINQIRNSNSIDAIILDHMHMRSEVTAIKEAAQKKAVPLIIYTSKFEGNIRDKAIELGVDEYLSGDFSYSFFKRIELIKSIKQFRNQKRKATNLTQSVSGSPASRMWLFKRTFDIFCSFSILLTLIPLFALIILLIKLESKGSVFQISKRVGMCFKTFNLYKFRSTFVENENKATVLTVTRVGHFLISSGLEKLPQLFSVLIGQMSLVGTRPLPPCYANSMTRDEIALRFLAPAGMLGLWSLAGHEQDDALGNDSIRLDIEYTFRNSMLLDLQIILCSLVQQFKKQKELTKTHAQEIALLL